MKLKYPEESNRQRISRMGADAFIVKKPRNWISYPLPTESDYGIDYVVQVLEDTSIKYKFTVQLKSSEDPRKLSNEKVIKISITAANLNYYRNMTEPLLIVFCDLSVHSDEPTEAPMYYIWVHEALKNTALERNHASYSIAIPIENKFSKEMDVIKLMEKASDSYHEFLKNREITTENYQTEFFQPMDIVKDDMYQFSTPLVSITGFLPSLKKARISGSCLITFSVHTVKDCMITFNHQEIMTSLFRGLFFSHIYNMRGVIVGGIVQDYQMLQLGNTRIHIPSKYASDLCNILDHFSLEYINRLSKIEDLFCSKRFQISPEGKAFYLVKISRKLWHSLQAFSKKFNADSGNSDWHIFYNNGDCITVSNKNMKIFHNNGHAVLMPLQVFNRGMDFQYVDDEIFIAWKIPNQQSWKNSSFGPEALWSVEYTYNWLVDKLIPYVFYYCEVVLSERKAFFSLKKKITFNEYAIKLDVSKLITSQKQKSLIKMDDVVCPTTLIELFEQLEYYLTINNQDPIYHELDDVKNIYVALKICLEQISDLDVGYVASKMGAYGTKNTKDLIAWIDFKIMNNDKLLLNTMLELALRCFINIFQSTKIQLPEEFIAQIKQRILWVWKGVDLILFLKRNSNFKEVNN